MIYQTVTSFLLNNLRAYLSGVQIVTIDVTYWVSESINLTALGSGVVAAMVWVKRISSLQTPTRKKY